MKNLLVALVLLLPIQTFSQEVAVQTYDVLIENATIIDGTGAGAYKGHLGIQENEIIFIGPQINHPYEANKIIDATGFTVTPGFIDPHSHGDPLETPEFKNFLAMGVTTITLGQDGYSPAEEDISLW